MTAGLARLAEAARHRFPDRELIVRANGQVAYVQLPHRRQLMWIGLGLVLTLWLAYASVSYVIFDRRLAAKNVEVDRAVSSYKNLKHNLTDAERKYVDVMRDLEDKNVYLQKTLDENGALRRNLDAISSVLDTVVAQRTRIAGERQVLEQRTVSMETRLKDIQIAQSDVLGRLGQRTADDIAQAERVVAMTGLDTDTMLGRNGSPRVGGGQGGPYVPALGGRDLDGLTGKSDYTVSMLDASIDRLEGLQRMLGQLPLGAPTENYAISSGFGVRVDPINGTAAAHYGLDMTGQMGQTIVATASGKVMSAERNGFYGKMVEIDHGMGVTTRYGHLSAITVEEGQIVAAGDKIGAMGSTGRSTGVHVHYEIRVDNKPLNPMKFIKAGHYVFKNNQ
ncbi:MAG: M23 family metallopeptidase [Rhodospirillales bacterium]